eukprot:GEMP01042857.1.p1 GENE.GEMP01042857.1~~GEMP01042857.1.p1  ORF type:complete len:352 (+),score=101.47 GEMP01042857.1:40-1056(+)
MTDYATTAACVTGVCGLLAFCVRGYFRSGLNLHDRHVLITGGSSGLGKELAREALRQGANVTLVARTKSKLEDAKRELLSEGEGTEGEEGHQWVELVSLDLTKGFTQIAETVNELVQRRGNVDVLINCTGNSIPGRFLEQDACVAEQMMQVNYLSAVHMTRAVLPHRPQRVCFVSSVAGLIGLYGYTSYTASKFALRGFAEALSMETHHHGTKITLCFPPEMHTPGYEEEINTTPDETKAMAEASFVDTSHVARCTLRDVRMGNFFSTSSVLGWAACTVAAGCSPETSIGSALVQVFLMGPFRVVVLVVLWWFYRIVDTMAKARASNGVCGNGGTRLQ